ncbi:MAG TPA: hypothetical protein VHM65_08655 [Candidatus Lustribacter sp.]|nr:hypothetical protein [Candidatus Lustribacter sp.]
MVLSRSAGRFAVAFLALGIVARGWMRLITTEPEFSWSGALDIVGAFVVFGVACGLVRGARRSGRSRVWRLLAPLCLGIGVGAGALLVPGVALTAWATSGRGPRWVRWLVPGILVAVAALGVAQDEGADLGRLAITVTGLWALTLGLGLGAREFLMRWPGRAHGVSERALRVVVP